jgi:hypothetical protein
MKLKRTKKEVERITQILIPSNTKEILLKKCDHKLIYPIPWVARYNYFFYKKLLNETKGSSKNAK